MVDIQEQTVYLCYPYDEIVSLKQILKSFLQDC